MRYPADRRTLQPEVRGILDSISKSEDERIQLTVAPIVRALRDAGQDVERLKRENRGLRQIIQDQTRQRFARVPEKTKGAVSPAPSALDGIQLRTAQEG